MATLERAIEIATEAHKNQTDRVGAPYIGHISRVMNLGRTEDEKICGILHDLIEDTNWTLVDLKAEGFSDKVIEAMECLTKKEGEDYENFINRIVDNPLAVKVKINDLRDNMDISRYQFISEKDISRINKYLKVYHRLIYL